MSELNIRSKLIEVQKKLKVPKSNFNKFGKYSYRSCEDILEAVKPLNAEYGLLLSISDEPVLIGDRHYIKATAMISDDKDIIEVTGYARESATKKGMDDSQITGTASSYARKYALNGLYLIDDTKDADTDAYQNQQQNAPRQQQAPPPQHQQQNNMPTQQELQELHNQIVNLANQFSIPQEQVLNQIGWSNQMDRTKYNQIQQYVRETTNNINNGGQQQ